jgi:hypothetical protein
MMVSARPFTLSLRACDASANDATHGVVVETDELAVVSTSGVVVAPVIGAT